MPTLRDEMTTLADSLALTPATLPVATQMRAILTAIPGDGSPDLPADLVLAVAKKIGVLWYNAKGQAAPPWPQIPQARRDAFVANAGAILRPLSSAVRDAVVAPSNDVSYEFSLNPGTPGDLTWTDVVEFYTLNEVPVGATYYRREVRRGAWEQETRTG